MSSSSEARVILLNERPSGFPDEKTFRFESTPIPSSAPDNKVLVKLLRLSVDPYLRGKIREFPLETPMVSYCVVEVVDSKNAKYKVGDLLTGVFAWQTYQVFDPEEESDVIIIDPKIKIPLSSWIGVCGMPGRTAYFGLLDYDIGRFKAGQNVLVSGAAGAVGSLVGQLAKIKGARRVIGTAGGPEKCKVVKEKYGFDECLDYKKFDTQEKMTEALKAAAPEGLDLYFDNTGGHVTFAAMSLLNKFGRVALCGNISAYNSEDGRGPDIPNIMNLGMVYGSYTIAGFLVYDFLVRNSLGKGFEPFYNEVPKLVESGKIVADEFVLNGFDSVPQAFAGLFTGANTGKMVVNVAEPGNK